MSSAFDPTDVNLTTADPKDVICYILAGVNEYNGHLGARISALFVILVVSTAATFFPVIAVRVPWLRINIYVYLFARYFGAGVIIATAFIQYDKPNPSSHFLLVADQTTAFSTQHTEKSALIHASE